jgi:ABC-2 type transport system permease protein
MRKIATLAWLNLEQVFKDRAGLFTLVALPLMLTMLFGTVMGGGERKSNIAVADLDRTEISAAIVAAFDPAVYSIHRVDEETARAMAASGEAVAGVVIPKGFSDDVLGGVDTTLTMYKDPRSTSVIAAQQVLTGRAERVAANALTSKCIQQALAGASAGGAAYSAPSSDLFRYADDMWEPQPPVFLRTLSVSRTKVRASTEQAMGFSQYSLGFTLMFMLFMAMGSAGGFLDEREQGTLARLLTTPTTKVKLVHGKVAGIYATVIFQASVMIVFGVALFHVPWGDDPLGVAMIISSFGLAATGLGVMISSLARTRGQVSALTAVGATAMSMLGGAYWPLDIVSPVMRTIALFTPVGWAMTGLTNVVVRSQGAAQAVMPTLALLGMAALFLGIGVSRLRLE